jgi:hypothetical protein
MSFESLKARRQNTQAIISELNKFKNTKKARTDNARFWSPKPDKQGNAHAVIRFLPSLESDNLNIPFVKMWDHGFQGDTGKWYIENSLRSINRTDPVAELNSTLWNSGLESNKEIVRKRKQRLHYIGNIYIIKDTLHPENEGKVMLYKFGAKIFDKIESAMLPPEGFDEEPIIPYDLWSGANFKLRLKKGDGGWPTYQDSSFESASPLFKLKNGEADEEKMEAIYSQIQSLLPFIDPEGVDADGEKYYKSYDELKEKLYRVLDLTPSENNSVPNTSASAKNRASVVETDEEDDNSEAAFPTSADDDDDEDNSLEYFASLVNDDD